MMDFDNIYILKEKDTAKINYGILPNLHIKTKFNFRKNNIKNMKYSDILNKNIEKCYNNNLSKVKSQIDKYYNCNKKEWDIIKKITNPFEMIYLTNKQDKRHSISLYDPLSRSYFKMIEMLHEFFSEYSSFNYNHKKIKTLHLAEGPGGFMEAFINFRKNKNDLYYGMTLLSDNKDIPGWNKSYYFINKHRNINLITGIDNRGDLYNIDNHYYLINRLGRNNMDIITGDGGFDFSVDYNLQEVLAQKLIFSQIIIGLSMLKVGGSFICKVFDIYTNLTQQFIYLLYIFYDEVIIYKPMTSRMANSERYIICRGFKGIKTLYLCELLNILDLWNTLEYKNSSLIILNIFEINNKNSKIYDNYEKFRIKLEKLNLIFENKQIENINTTINIIRYPPSNKWYKENFSKQLRIAIQWCKKYNVNYKTYIYNLNYKDLYKLE